MLTKLMKKLFFFFLAGFLFLPLGALAFEFNEEITPIITTSAEAIEQERNVIFDADSSLILEDPENPELPLSPLSFEWDFGDGTTATGEEVVHTFGQSGTYEIILTITQGEEDAQRQAVSTQSVFVYEKLVLFLTDMNEEKERIERAINEAQQQGVSVLLMESYDTQTSFATEEALAKSLRDQLSALADTSTIVVWTKSGLINALSRIAQEGLEDPAGAQNYFQGKTIVVITDKNLETTAKILQGSFEVIQPKQIIITRRHEFENLVNAETPDDFLVNLEASLSDYTVVNEETGRVSIYNSMSYLVSFMISKGVPSDVIVLLLMLPVIATIIAFLRQVVGITTFGVYTPSIITLSFLALGLKFGLMILFIIIITGAIVRKALERFRLMHVPRVAIVLTFSTLIILLTLALGTYLGISSLATIAIFPMLIMTTLAEKFVSALGGKGFKSALIVMGETTLVSLICYVVVELQFLKDLMLAHPEIILLLLIFNYILGRWSGLRILEFVRFREVMKHAEE